MDLKLTEDQRQILGTVRELVQTKFRDRAPRYMNGDFPWENIQDLAPIGVLGMAVSEKYGGLGMSVLDTALVLEEIAKVDYVTAMAVLGEVGTQTRIIETFAPDHVKEAILPGVCDGSVILAIAMTEPHAGTDISNAKTNTVVKGDRVVVKGTKTLISRVDEAKYFVVFTRVDGEPGSAGIGCVLVHRDTPGFEVIARYHTMGGENLAEIQFNDCELPIENLIVPRDGLRLLMSAFNTQRCLNPSISLGMAEGGFEEAIRYIRARPLFGKFVSDSQGVRWKLAEMYRDIEVGRSMLYRACASANPFPDPILSANAKWYCNDMSVRVISQALQFHGGYGFTDEYPVSRLYRGARYGSLGGGTTETLQDMIGRNLVKEFSDSTGFLGYGMM